MARLPKSIIKKYGITKKAWSVFRGRRKGSARTSSFKSPRKIGGGMRSMVKRRGHKRGSLISGVEKIGTLIAFVAPGIEAYASGKKPLINWLVARYTGYSLDQGQFQWNRLAEGWGPVVMFTAAKLAAHKVMGLLRRI